MTNWHCIMISKAIVSGFFNHWDASNSLFFSPLMYNVIFRFLKFANYSSDRYSVKLHPAFLFEHHDYGIEQRLQNKLLYLNSCLFSYAIQTSSVLKLMTNDFKWTVIRLISEYLSIYEKKIEYNNTTRIFIIVKIAANVISRTAT